MIFIRSLKNVLKNSFFCFLLLIFCNSLVYSKEFILEYPLNNQVIKSYYPKSSVTIRYINGGYQKIFINGELAPSDKRNSQFEMNINGFGKNRLFIQAYDNKQIKYIRNNIILLRTFPDIKNHWASYEIELVSTLGYMDGLYGGINFSPDTAVTRAELAKVLAKLNKLKVSRYENEEIHDLLYNHWARPYINAVVNLGMMSLDREKNFYPQGLVTRADVFSAFSKALDWDIKYSRDQFLSDVAKNYWARDAIYTAMYMKIFPGYWDLSKGIKPGNILTRSELAALLARLGIVQDDIKELLGNKVVFEHSFHEQQQQQQHEYRDDWALIDISSSNVYVDGEQIVTVKVNTNINNELRNVRKVEIDLTSLGRLANTAMLDDGLWSDTYSGDGVFSVEFVPVMGIEYGVKEIPLQMVDIYGRTYESMVTVNLIPKPIEIIVPKEEPSIITKDAVNSDEVAYIVKPGDTLMIISRRMTGTKYNWKKIAQYNNVKIVEKTIKGKVRYIVKIKVGQSIAIPVSLLKK